MDVSSSGYYELIKARRKRTEETKKAIGKSNPLCIYGLWKTVRESENHQIIGARRMQGITENRIPLYEKNGNCVGNEEEIQSNYQLQTLSSGHKNVLNQQFNTEKPNEKWVTDITYIHKDEGWLYLAKFHSVKTGSYPYVFNLSSSMLINILFPFLATPSKTISFPFVMVISSIPSLFDLFAC
ncbi:hypothetical protein [Shimazuella kribbensis]|uniref:hypothetical protein n=1 Tax=Shimazuella kribbensis TaxID=139808 RepID=UPI0006879C44|nr:hypothetical protein [Shimazuella kribbensis]